MLKQFEEYKRNIRQKGLWRKRSAVELLAEGTILINNKKYINFCSNDYLGLRNHPKIKMAMQLSLQQYGFGSSSSPLLTGYSMECKELEKTFCQLLGFEDAIVFSSGYQANIGVLSSLLTRNSKVLCDRLCHASILDGIHLSGSKLQRFRHNNVDHAHALIKATSPDLFITESVFSMEGDITPFDKFLSLSLSPSTFFCIDDAHGFGALGKNGLGVVDHWKLKPDILIVPFGKAVCISGAIVLAKKETISLILQNCRSYRYSTAISPVICRGVLESLNIMLEEKEHLQNLRAIIHFFNQCAYEYNLPLISNDITPIRSILIGDSKRTLSIGKYLKSKGLYVAVIRPPTVPVNTSRLRISLGCNHKPPDILRLVRLIKEAME